MMALHPSLPLQRPTGAVASEWPSPPEWPLPPNKTCFECRGCCVFHEPDSPWRPYFRKTEIDRARAAGIPENAFPQQTDSKHTGVKIALLPLGDSFYCPALDPVTHACTIYPSRPLDCQLYPFTLMWKTDKIVLALHEACPFVFSQGGHQGPLEGNLYHRANALIAELQSPETLQQIADDPGLIMPTQPDLIPIVVLDLMTAAVLKRSKNFKTVSLKPFRPEDYPLFETYRSKRRTELAHTAFQPHAIGSDLLEYRWAILADSFCLFATAGGVTHLACPPLGENVMESTVEAFAVIADLNPPWVPPRMDNVDEETARELEKIGYQKRPSSPDYIYRRDDIVNLSGNRFRSQRAAVNQAARHGLILRPFTPEDRPACLTLFNQWASRFATRPIQDKTDDEAMMREDAYAMHSAILQRTDELALTGRVVCKNDLLCGYTFGFWFSPDQFCVLVEIADRTIRGLSAWLFHEFCKTLHDALWINAMDDSGLPRLARAKSLWHPEKVVPTYTVSPGSPSSTP